MSLKLTPKQSSWAAFAGKSTFSRLEHAAKVGSDPYHDEAGIAALFPWSRSPSTTMARRRCAGRAAPSGGGILLDPGLQDKGRFISDSPIGRRRRRTLSRTAFPETAVHDAHTRAATTAGAPSSNLARNTFFLLAGQAASSALSLMLTAVLGRWLGVAEFVVYFLLVAGSTFAYLLVDWRAHI